MHQITEMRSEQFEGSDFISPSEQAAANGLAALRAVNQSKTEANVGNQGDSDAAWMFEETQQEEYD